MDKVKEEIGNNGHATLEDLLEEEDEAECEIKFSGNTLLLIEGNIGGKVNVEAVIDTGETHSCIDIEYYKNLLEMGCIKRITGVKDGNHSGSGE